MLIKIANFITENPIIVIIGFLCSIIGTTEVVYSLIINLKTKKQKEELERQRKDIYRTFFMRDVHRSFSCRFIRRIY